MSGECTSVNGQSLLTVKGYAEALVSVLEELVLV